ncbi:tyrosine-protein phosphatase [Rhodococcus sp. Q]|uniref:tyrosine-protein phosphatase n=1 Tax=Rhodococcus sp. Q TaxID=2502252 RepID=UPI0010F8BAA3|nr:tyrosine-protein phosphatase [Rhodococcus sp. Q]
MRHRGRYASSSGPTDWTISVADVAALTALGVADIYDLRGRTESTNPMVGGPDWAPRGNR